MHPSNLAYFHFVVIKSSNGVVVGAVIDQMRRAQRSIENETDRVRSRTPILVKITLSESQAEAKE